MARKRMGKRVPKNVRTYVQKSIQRNQETYFRGGSYTGDTIQDPARAPIDTLISAVAQGDGQSERSGNQILATGFYGKFVLQTADSTNIVRCVMYIPKDPTDTLSGVSITDLIDQDRFTILHDKLYHMSTYRPQVSFVLARKWNRGRRRGLLTQFTGAANNTGTKNVVRLYFVSDSTAVSDPAIQGNFRYYYKDG